MSVKVQIQTVKFVDFEMNYIVFGTGKKPFVIIPGLSLKPVLDSAEAIASAYQAFTEDYSVYVFERKKNIEEDYCVKDMAIDTAAAMKQLGIANADIFGASQGGMIAQCIAIYYPELVHKLVLGSTLSRPNEMSRQVFGDWIKLANAGNIRALNHHMFGKIYSRGYLEKYHDLFLALENENFEPDLKRFKILTKACAVFDDYDELDKISCPVFVMGAVNDNVLSGAASREIAEKLCCEIYMYDIYGHAVFDEAPDYKERILQFLNQ